MSIANIVKIMMNNKESPTVLAHSMQDFTLLEEIKNRLGSVTEKDLPTEDKIYRSSELSHMCAREEVLRFIHKVPKQEKIDPKTQIIFDFGNAFNDLFQQKWLSNWEILIGDWICESCWHIYAFQKKPAQCGTCLHGKFKYRELEFIDKKFSISGHPDGILEKNGRKKVLELKTCNSQIFKYVTEVLRNPMYHHVDQIHLYMWKYKIGEGIVLYLNKDTGDLAEFKIPYQTSRIETMFRKIKAAKDGIKTKVLPQREVCAKADCARAKRCGVKKWCFEDG